MTASPEFFKGKKKGEIKAYFQEALGFIQEHQDPRTIIFRRGAYGRENAPICTFASSR